MKRLSLLFAALISATTFAFGGGMVHNTNQSAAWIRTLVRDASTSVDAVFYNPAGLTQLADGFHFQLNTQTVGQTRTVTSDYPALNKSEFGGTTSVPILPTFFAVYKTGNLAVSAGFTVVGGGGSASFEEGLPSFEIPVSQIPGALSASGIPTTGYQADISFEGSSTYFGYQLNFSYKINDMISVALGGRYVSATNSYVGGIKNIMINPNYPAAGFSGSMVSAPAFFTTMATNLTTLAGGATSFANSLNTAMGTGVPAATPLSAALTAEQYAQASQILVAAGVPAAAISTMNIGTASAYFTAAAPVFTQNAAVMTGYAAKTADVDVDAKQVGNTFTPIFGVNLSLLENKLNVAMKYEMASKMTVKNETTVDGSGLFPDGVENNSDIPAFFSFGADYKVMDNLKLSFGTHYYWDMNVSYGKSFNGETNVKNDLVLNSNAYEFAGGFEYGLNEKLALSAGYLFTSSAPRNEYQSDLSYSLNTNSIGLGGNYKVNDNFGIDLGFLNTFYMGKDILANGVTTGYDKTAWVLSFGFTYALTK